MSTLTIDGTHVRMTMAAGVAARLFGLPFLLVGGYLGFQLVGGVIDLVVGRASIGEMLAGTVLLAIITAAFLVPGWMLAFARASVDIDRVARTATCTRDFRIYQSRTVRPLSDFTRVEVDHLSVSANRASSGKSSYQVELAATNRSNVVAGLFDDRDAALAFGRELGAIVELPVVDRRSLSE